MIIKIVKSGLIKKLCRPLRSITGKDTVVTHRYPVERMKTQIPVTVVFE